MFSWIARLFGHYKAYHQPSPLLLRYMCVFGLVGFPLLYAVRFLRPTAGYDDLALRLFNTGLLALLLLRERWPASLKPYFLHASYAVMTIALPFTFVFTSLKNGGGPAAVGNTFMAAFLLILLADWRNMIVMVVVGFSAAGALYAATDPAPRLAIDYVMRLPVLIVGLVGGTLFKFALEHATAERVRQAYASLAGSIAHEMRNPMAQVRHSLENIRQALPLPTLHAQPQVVEGSTVDLLYRHVAQGELAVKRGLQVIAMTLDEVNAKPLDPGKLAYLSAADVCRKAVEEYGYENEQQRARVSLVVRRDFVFRGEETAFLFVLFNLMKNALYYLPAFPDARLQVTVDGGEVKVRDTGPGVPAEVLPRLFQPFATGGKTGGTGLGLAYCRRVMESFGGTIGCASEHGAYTEFTLGFSAVPPEEVEAHRATALARAGGVLGGRRVLVVDDEPGMRHATRLKLLPAGCTVEEAADGIQALQRLKEQAFDALVLDLNMPRMDGYELAEAIRAGMAPANQGVAILANTSEPPHLARVKTENAGMDGFVAKGSEQLVLLQGLCRAMESRARSAMRSGGWLTGRRILLADDNAYNRAAVGGYLKHAGAAVTEVGSGSAALQALGEGVAYDLVLLDIHMPGMDGVATAREVRRRDVAVPMLAITAHAGPELAASARAAGIADFITKPVEAELLYDQVAALLGIEGRPAGAVPQAPAMRQEAGNLLDENRLEGYRRIGMLDELLDEYGPEIDRLAARLDAAVAQRDLQSALDALHSLVGMSGEAGAQALHRYARGVYVPMLEQQAWPGDASWLATLRELTVTTGDALREWSAARRGAPV